MKLLKSPVKSRVFRELVRQTGIYRIAAANRAVVHRKMPAIQARGCPRALPAKLKFVFHGEKKCAPRNRGAEVFLTDVLR